MKVVLYGILALSVIFFIYQMITVWKALKGLKKANKEFAESSKTFQDSCNQLAESLRKKFQNNQ